MFKYVNIFGILDSVSYLLGFLISSVIKFSWFLKNKVWFRQGDSLILVLLIDFQLICS